MAPAAPGRARAAEAAGAASEAAAAAAAPPPRTQRHGESGAGAAAARGFAAKPDLHLSKQGLRSAIAPCGALFLNGAPDELAYLASEAIASTRDRDNSDALARVDMWMSMLGGTVETGADVLRQLHGEVAGAAAAAPEAVLQSLGTAEGEAFLAACAYLNAKNRTARGPEQTKRHVRAFVDYSGGLSARSDLAPIYAQRAVADAVRGRGASVLGTLGEGGPQGA